MSTPFNREPTAALNTDPDVPAVDDKDGDGDGGDGGGHIGPRIGPNNEKRGRRLKERYRKGIDLMTSS